MQYFDRNWYKYFRKNTMIAEYYCLRLKKVTYIKYFKKVFQYIIRRGIIVQFIEIFSEIHYFKFQPFFSRYSAAHLVIFIHAKWNFIMSYCIPCTSKIVMYKRVDLNRLFFLLRFICMQINTSNRSLFASSSWCFFSLSSHRLIVKICCSHFYRQHHQFCF